MKPKSRSRALSLLDCIADPQLFAPWFRKPQTWSAWLCFLRAVFGLPLLSSDGYLYAQCTGRGASPESAVSEAWLICGRRSGKSFIAALIAVFLACFRSYKQYLAPGERGVVMVLACDRKQARVVFRYIQALVTHIPMLAQLVVLPKAESIELNNGIDIEVHTASFRAVRGRTVVAAICDEIAFWRSDDSANPDREILDAIRPAMATIPNAMLICLSSPYSRRGELYRTFERYYGDSNSQVLVWRADTLTMNPTVSERVISDAYDRDATAAATEYGAEFRTDLSTAIDEALIDAAIDTGVLMREPTRAFGTPSLYTYRGFVDAAGGSGADSYTVGIAHNERGNAVLDALLEIRPPFSTSTATEQVAVLLKRYGISHVTGDRYGGDWPAQELLKHGISYTASEFSKSEIYLEVIPLFSAGRVRLLANERLLAQLRQLERRTGRSGRDSVDHTPGSHDDIANAACGALLRAVKMINAGDNQTIFTTSSIADGINGANVERPRLVSIFDRDPNGIDRFDW